jgi:hypothetical protein
MLLTMLHNVVATAESYQFKRHKIKRVASRCVPQLVYCKSSYAGVDFALTFDPEKAACVAMGDFYSNMLLSSNFCTAKILIHL